jgi:uncharacterized protein (DUF362 family)
MGFSAGIKNFYGTATGLMKVEYRKYTSKNKDFANLLTKEGNGPSAGEIRKTDLIAASQDTAVLDAYLMKELNYNISSSDLLKNLNMTVDIINKVEVLGKSSKDFNFQKFKFSNLRKLDIFPKPIARTLGKLLRAKANVDKSICVKCLLCANACPVGAIQIKGNDYPYVNTRDA